MIRNKLRENIINMNSLQENYADAEQWWLLAKREATAGFGSDEGHQAVVANGLADVYRCQGGEKFKLAESLYHESLDITTRCYGTGDVRYAQALQNLGQYLSDAGQHGEALKNIRSALAVKQLVFGRKHIECARVRCTSCSRIPLVPLLLDFTDHVARRKVALSECR
jgi:tetratricopeptide (TPR) repeat protein